MSDAIKDVIAERERQQTVEGWTASHDDKHDMGQLAGAAVCYVVHGLRSAAKHSVHRSYWDWDEEWFKPTSRRRDLVKAAALILAEIERLDRAS
ncbi:hypothetical protein KEM44_20970 [Sinorhizobium meliloti]|uniref:hypothetical protein n=1 Tax=Rhizobium meliloti TaxID=382 RepID=UPI000B5AA0BB|nr:hypothetical protein [Sinorhizobium meliloti]ASJ58960.1 hypothetical protein SMB554_07010 [Sinorhizobium meliloti]MCK3783511.1 hypothetical protein [Sinorhizobium meliloti]MCK3787859.1 hypothetical protein [Sinorhizobium meliloti]MCK3794864.1 hypothetical protein [Sinorhizobium meliloti]UTG98603.1 hypothetical protein KEM44_20970 [Sinorhizobium meliloti]